MFSIEPRETFDMLVASDPNGVIGKDNTLPWSIADDLKWFKQKTTGGIIIMGRKTWESLPKNYLPNRINIVLTRNTEKTFSKIKKEDIHSEFGPFFFEDVSDVKHFCNELIGPDIPRFVIGGSSIKFFYIL